MAPLEQELGAGLLRAPVEERRGEVGLDGEPEIRRLDVVARRQAAHLAGEGLHPGPVAHVLDHRVGVHQVEAVIGMLGNRAGVADHRCEQRVLSAEPLRVHQSDVDL